MNFAKEKENDSEFRKKKYFLLRNFTKKNLIFAFFMNGMQKKAKMSLSVEEEKTFLKKV